jgi:hypothetical protein
MHRSTCALVSLALVASACSGANQVGREVEQNLNPFASSRVSLLSVRTVGPYLEAQFRSRSSVLTFFAPAHDPGCAQLLRPEVTLVYRRHGNFGRFEDGDVRCDAVGIGSLAAWRNRRPRDPRRSTMVPRASATFREIGRDGDVVLVRGRFPLASRVGIPASFDLVAFLPAAPECERPLARGAGSLEFVPAGQQAFRIVSDNTTCPVLGFAMPLEAAPAG